MRTKRVIGCNYCDIARIAKSFSDSISQEYIVNTVSRHRGDLCGSTSILPELLKTIAALTHLWLVASQFASAVNVLGRTLISGALITVKRFAV